MNDIDNDKHGLTAGNINQKDKQNFESIGTLMSYDVLRGLEEISKIPMEGTIFYLKVM